MFCFGCTAWNFFYCFLFIDLSYGEAPPFPYNFYSSQEDKEEMVSRVKDIDKE